jgi:dTDP-4-dehydrorhamnose 3,5-epimerase
MGMATMTINCTLLYKMDNWYEPTKQGCIRWDDPQLKIDWGITHPVLSERDAQGMLFNEFVIKHGGISL